MSDNKYEARVVTSITNLREKISNHIKIIASHEENNSNIDTAITALNQSKYIVQDNTEAVLAIDNAIAQKIREKEQNINQIQSTVDCLTKCKETLSYLRYNICPHVKTKVNGYDSHRHEDTYECVTCGMDI